MGEVVDDAGDLDAGQQVLGEGFDAVGGADEGYGPGITGGCFIWLG